MFRAIAAGVVITGLFSASGCSGQNQTQADWPLEEKSSTVGTVVNNVVDKVNESLAPEWIKQTVRGHLERHGQFQGDEYITFIDYHDGNSSPNLFTGRVDIDFILKPMEEREEHKKIFIHVKGLEVVPKMVELTPADRLNGYQWAADIELKATAYREGNEKDRGFGSWNNGLNYYMRRVIRCEMWNDKITWSMDGTHNSNASGVDNFFNSVFNAFRHPKEPEGRRNDLCAIRTVLIHDEMISDWYRTNEIAESKNEKAIEAFLNEMSKIDLSKCPADFAETYRSHRKAWRDKDPSAINTTYGELLRLARNYGVGTARYSGHLQTQPVGAAGARN